MKAARLLALTLLVGLAGIHRAEADDNSKKIYQQTLKSTAWVKVEMSKDSYATGTGWVVDRDKKLLVTNHHVVGNATNVLVLFPVYKDGQLVSERRAYSEERGVRGKVLDTDVPSDLAVIQLIDPMPEGTVELKLAAQSAGPGEHVHSIGNPGASDALWVYTDGKIRTGAHKKEWHSFDMKARLVDRRNCRVIESQSPINAGDSGGPVVNDAGEVVAVVSSSTVKSGGRDVQLMAINIDVSEVKQFLQQTRRQMDPKTAADYQLKGSRLVERRRYNDAIDDLTMAIKLDPKNALAYQRRGWAFSCKGDHDTAIADCTKALSIDPDDAVSYENRGWAHNQKGDYDKALEDYNQAIRIDPKFSRALNSRAVLYELRKKDNRRAMDNYNWAIEADPKNDLALAYRADLHHTLKNYKQAFEDADRALDINPFSVLGWNVRGWALRDNQQFSSALDNFTAALRFDDNLAFYLNRGIIHVRMADKISERNKDWLQAMTSAETDYNRCLERNKSYAAAWFYRGQLFEKAGMMQPCQRDYETAIQHAKSYRDRLKNLKQCYLRIRNQANEPVRVHVQYEYMTDKGNFVFYPDNVQRTFWDFAQNEQAYLITEGWKVYGRRARIWVTGRDSGTQYENGRLIQLAPENGYLAGGLMTFDFTIK